jgi:hypothetical protein
MALIKNLGRHNSGGQSTSEGNKEGARDGGRAGGGRERQWIGSQRTRGARCRWWADARKVNRIGVKFRVREPTIVTDNTP